MYSLHVTILAAVVYSLSVAGSPSLLFGASADKIVKNDAESGCLSLAAEAIRGADRETLNTLAHNLRLSLFRDIHQFAPAASALGLPEVKQRILGADYPTAVNALSELKSYFQSNIPEISENATETSSAEECDAPTAVNLRTIYINLGKLVREF
ncbi:hypothetical protein COEREDRAFT_81249 [Coemansia reversa NRRL 1564]|uniref:Uncharacterized protein n=1 Tax=Coemansia reversa (strain ATCC 12441 / NRRL 1564) TaxID=763665 RepID=A0A2G5BC77_COERN|nr:hypothetical protein COEREDRAFT_97451 [Coemansia reversa NRRL 1564]PIA16601.1 hypothetical protein COEREDRAFT_81249 [Coemansia reversa NRRL 1564]|eukprot:PIA16597.1 hypothetical protein COEREDRAFT_97451 [Coemansia reversa NRRL 1564]